MSISTHVLDTSAGKPAAGISVRLESLSEDGQWRVVGSGVTDTDGRITDLLDTDASKLPGSYRLSFETGGYFERAGISSFHPQVQIDFIVRDRDEHYHVPLLLSPFGYTTYRGS